MIAAAVAQCPEGTAADTSQTAAGSEIVNLAET